MSDIPNTNPMHVDPDNVIIYWSDEEGTLHPQSLSDHIHAGDLVTWDDDGYELELEYHHTEVTSIAPRTLT